MKLTDGWPVIVHPCVDGLPGTYQWKRAATDGMEGECRCGTVFRYVKARPVSGSSGGEPGPRTHF